MVGSIVEQHPFVGRKHATKQNIPDQILARYYPENEHGIQKSVVCRCVSFSKGAFFRFHDNLPGRIVGRCRVFALLWAFFAAYHLSPQASNEGCIPIGSMYDIFTCIWLILMVNVGKCTICGSYGIYVYVFRPISH